MGPKQEICTTHRERVETSGEECWNECGQPIWNRKKTISFPWTTLPQATSFGETQKRQKQKRSSSRDGRLHLAPRCGEQQSKAKYLTARVIRKQLWNETENLRMRHAWKISRHPNLSRGKFSDFEVVSWHAESDKSLFVT